MDILQDLEGTGNLRRLSDLIDFETDIRAQTVVRTEAQEDGWGE